MSNNLIGNFRRWLAVVGVLVLVPLGSVQVFGQSPQTQPLLQQSDLQYLGSFDVPWSDGTCNSGTGAGCLSYGGHALALSPSGGLYWGGHDWMQQLCEISRPAIGGTAAIIQSCVDVLEGKRTLVDDGNVKLGGVLPHDGGLVVSAWSYYDGDADQSQSHFTSGQTFATTGDVLGPFQLGTWDAGFVSRYMAPVPAAWQSLLGGVAVAGNCCVPIISRTSSGPALAAFNPDDLGDVNPVPASMLVGYPLATPLAEGDTQNPYFTLADSVAGVAFPTGTRSVLFIGTHGTGTYCYGDVPPCIDPVIGSKGPHSYPYVDYVWAYDANDLLAVKQGTMQPWEIEPYALWTLGDITPGGATGFAGVAYDPATQRLYLSTGGETRKVHVYQLNVAAPPPPTGESFTFASTVPIGAQTITVSVAVSVGEASTTVQLPVTVPAGAQQVEGVCTRPAGGVWTCNVKPAPQE